MTNARAFVATALVALLGSARAEVVVLNAELMPLAGASCRKLDNAADCSIGIRIEEEKAGDGKVTGCTIKLADPGEHEEVGIRRGLTNGLWLRWKIESRPAGSDYVFETDGIEFAANPSPKQFRFPTISIDRLTYWWHARNTLAAARFNEYVVNVRNSSGTIRCELDPWIKNQ